MHPTRIPRLSAAVLGLILAGAAAAQTTLRPALTAEGAKRAVAAAVAEARRSGAGGAVAVVDDGGHLLAFERLDGTFPMSATVSVGKARTAALFRKSTGFFEELVNKGRTSMAALSDFTPLQGGVPIEVDGHVVGAVGVSGAKSAPHDEEIARAAAAAVRATPAASGNGAGFSSADVTWIAGERVAAAFQKGAPLVEVAEYKVHASHRDAPGQAEVHHGETDILYVLEGTATFVTGGVVVDGRETAPGEIRGPALEGGTARTLRKGDVVIVPAGTPHWFQEVPGPIDYYAVKVAGR